MKGRLRQSPLAEPKRAFRHGQALTKESPHQCVEPAAQIILLMIVQHAADVIRMVKEMVHHRPDAKTENVAKPLSCRQLEAQRVAQKLTESAVRQRKKLSDSWGHSHNVVFSG